MRPIKLEERGLLERTRDQQDHRILKISDLAEEGYFSSPDTKDRQIDESNNN